MADLDCAPSASTGVASVDAIVRRALTWAHEQDAVSGLVLYGSAALGRAHSHSDADLLVEFRSNERDEWWERRQGLATRLLGAEPIFTRELPWQRDHRFQALAADLVGVDLTFDERPLRPPPTIRAGYRVLLDRTELARRLDDAIAEPEDATAAAQPGSDLDADTWMWLLGLHGQLRHGRTWKVYAELVRLHAERVAPLVVPPGVVAEDASVAERLAPALPGSSDTGELARALTETAELYALLRQARVGDQAAPAALASRVRAALRGR